MIQNDLYLTQQFWKKFPNVKLHIFRGGTVMKNVFAKISHVFFSGALVALSAFLMTSANQVCWGPTYQEKAPEGMERFKKLK